MKILVTGGAGFIGANFIHYWLKHHPLDEITNLDKLTYAGNLESLRSIKDDKPYFFFKGDICHPADVEQVVKGKEVIIHFAAESHVDRSISGPAVFAMTNVIGTQVLLDAAVKHKIKHFHHVSTDEVFGSLELGSKDKFNEESPFRPNSPYAASKAGSDHLVRAYVNTYGLKATITNTSNNYGPYQFPEKFLPLAITNLLEGKKIPIYGDGLHVRDWLFVEDHCRAIELVLKKGRVGETYCIGGGLKELNNLEVAKMICQSLGKNESWIEFVKDRPGHDRRYALDWTKATQELGYQPLHDFDSWLSKTIVWYKNNQSWWRSLKEKHKEYFKKQYNQ